MRTPLSKQRNKHIQRVLVEAAKLAPRQDHDLALVYETEKQKRNTNRATLAVARKMVAYLLAVDRGKNGTSCPQKITRERRPRNLRLGKNKRSHSAQAARSCRLPTERRRSNSRGSLRIVSGLAANTDSIFCDGLHGPRQRMDVRALRFLN